MFVEILKYLVIMMMLHGFNLHSSRVKNHKNLNQQLTYDSLVIQRYDSLLINLK